MSRWLTLTGAALMTMVVLSAPAQAGPLQGLPTPPDVPMGGGEIGGLVNEVRGQAQQLVHDTVGNEPFKTLAHIIDYAREVQERAKKVPDCIKVTMEFAPDADISGPEMTYGDDGDSHWTTIDAGKIFVRVLVKDCTDTAYHPESGPFP